MATPQRTVRHLRLSAPSRAQALSMLPRLEDALRCASLPDDGARLLVVRRLALGRLPHGIEAGALSRLIEQRVAAAEGCWVDADALGAASADGVVFASVLDARIALSLRLLRGEPAADWYWPLAVPEAPPTLSPHDRLRAIGWAVAQSPESSVALPAWAAALVRNLRDLPDRGAAVLAGLWSPAEGAALLRVAGLALSVADGDGGDNADNADNADHGPGAAVARAPGALAASAGPPLPVGTKPALLAWLQRLLAADRGWSMAEPAGSSASRGPPQRLAAAGPGASPTAAGHGPPPTGDRSGADRSGHSTAAQRPAPAPARPSPARAGRRGEPASLAPARATGHRLPRLDTTPAWQAWPAGEPTAAGGLLFLLPVLARLGLPAWRAAQGDTPAFVAVVLGLALQRLRLAHDDAAWLLVGSLAGSVDGWVGAAPVGALATEPAAAAPALPAGPAPAPACWQDLRLARRGQAAGRIAWQLAAAPTGTAQAALWLDACRRWLRRSGGIGLASLLRRPARLALTASHVDLFFRLAQTDLRVRRLGLDIDPGWLPWFGRVVAFHYRQGPR